MKNRLLALLMFLPSLAWATSMDTLTLTNPQTLAGLGAPANGTSRFCSDCTVGTTPCVSGGTGTVARRENGAWSCGGIPSVATGSLLGNNSGITGTPTGLTATQATAILNPVVGDSGSGGTKGLVPAPASGDAAAGKFLKADGTFAVPAGSSGITSLTGDVTGTGPGATATTITNGAVTLPKIAAQANNTVLGNSSGGSASPTALTALPAVTANVVTVTPTTGPTVSRPIAFWEGQVKTPAMYGTVGTSDDTATFNTAVTRILADTPANRPYLYIPCGTYFLREWTIPARVHVRGGGQQCTKLRFATSGNAATDAASYVIRWTGSLGSIGDLTIDGLISGSSFNIGNGIKIEQGTSGAYERLLYNVRIEFFGGYKASPSGGTYGTNGNYAANDIRDPTTGAFLLTGGDAITISNDEGYASSMVIDGLIVNRVDGFCLDVGRANDSRFMNMQLGSCTRGGLAQRFGSKNNQMANIKVFRCRRLNTAVFGSDPDIIPFFGTAATDPEAAVILTGTNLQAVNFEAQENGSHGYRLGFDIYSLYHGTLDITADGNGGYIHGASVGDAADARRYGVNAVTYYDLNLRLNGYDFRSGSNEGRQERAINVSAPPSITALAGLHTQEFYKIVSAAGGANFVPLQVGLTTTSNAVGFIFQAREATFGGGLSGSTAFGSGSLSAANDGLNLSSTISGQWEQDHDTGPGWNLANDSGVHSTYIINGVLRTSSSLGANVITSTKTSNYTVIVSDRGTHFDNIGASAQVDFTLPTAAAGLNYCFAVDASQTVRVIAVGSDKISLGSTNSATAGNLSSGTSLSNLCIASQKAAQWMTISGQGPWVAN